MRSAGRRVLADSVEVSVPAVIDGEEEFGGAGDMHGYRVQSRTQVMQTPEAGQQRRSYHRRAVFQLIILNLFFPRDIATVSRIR